MAQRTLRQESTQRDCWLDDADDYHSRSCCRLALCHRIGHLYMVWRSGAWLYRLSSKRYFFIGIILRTATCAGLSRRTISDELLFDHIIRDLYVRIGLIHISIFLNCKFFAFLFVSIQLIINTLHILNNIHFKYTRYVVCAIKRDKKTHKLLFHLT